jgi:hypothetical protein
MWVNYVRKQKRPEAGLTSGHSWNSLPWTRNPGVETTGGVDDSERTQHLCINYHSTMFLSISL